MTHRNKSKRNNRTLFMWICASVVAVLMLAAGTIWWHANSQPAPDSAAANGATAATPIEVTRGNLTPVGTLKAVAAASREYVILNPARGTVQPTSSKPGDLIKGGQAAFMSGSVSVKAPSNCQVSAWLQTGVDLPAGLPVLKCVYPGFVLEAAIDSSSAYQTLSGTLSAKGLLDNGPGPFDCTPVVAAPATDAAATATIKVLCAIPSDVKALPGATGLVALRSEVVRDAVLVPKSAVMGSLGKGVVGKMQGDRVVATEVALGATDGNLIQIVSGLSAGDKVTPTPPSLESQ